jgi:hypothetical protein
VREIREREIERQQQECQQRRLGGEREGRRRRELGGEIPLPVPLQRERECGVNNRY